MGQLDFDGALKHSSRIWNGEQIEGVLIDMPGKKGSEENSIGSIYRGRYLKDLFSQAVVVNDG